MRDVAILGCGPAGLLAALAVEQAGFNPVIYSIKAKSVMPGAQFLHEPIVGLTNDDPDMEITFIKQGTKEVYAMKVYGDPEAPCSWDDYPQGARPAWSLSDAYDRLWDRYGDQVIEGAVKPLSLNTIESMYDLVFSTIPAPVLCSNWLHRFPSASVWIRSWNHADTSAKPFVEYNGSQLVGYYRMSTIGGWSSTEFGHRALNTVEGKKPLGTDCNCRPEIHRLGRFGKWQKGVLVHHAYHEAKEVVNALL